MNKEEMIKEIIKWVDDNVTNASDERASPLNVVEYDELIEFLENKLNK